jgi:hypothetical protein
MKEIEMVKIKVNQSKLEDQTTASMTRFNAMTGEELNEEEKAFLPPYPYRQKLLWVPSGRVDKGRIRPVIDFPEYKGEEPDRVWTLFEHRMESDPPKLPFFPRHRFNAFVEDPIHDWNIYGGEFRYMSRFIHDGGVWLLLEFIDESLIR